MITLVHCQLCLFALLPEIHCVVSFMFYAFFPDVFLIRFMKCHFQYKKLIRLFMLLFINYLLLFKYILPKSGPL